MLCVHIFHCLLTKMLEAEDKLRKHGLLQTDDELENFRNKVSSVKNLEVYVGELDSECTAHSSQSPVCIFTSSYFSRLCLLTCLMLVLVIICLCIQCVRYLFLDECIRAKKTSASKGGRPLSKISESRENSARSRPVTMAKKQVCPLIHIKPSV